MAKITDRDAVRFVDKDVRIAVKRLVMNYQGKRLPKELRKFLKYKRKHLDDPWRFKGVDDDGNKGTWKKNADSTALKKFGKTCRRCFAETGITRWSRWRRGQTWPVAVLWKRRNTN